MTRIVVGVDGSAGAALALEHAAEEARLRHAILEVVHVRPLHRPASPFAHGLSADLVAGDLYAQMVEREREERERYAERSRQQGETLLSDAVESLPHDQPKVETTLLFDRRPARRLVDLIHERDDCALFVVGSRGRGELTGLLLGSVSQACVNHAGVPVTVVPTD